jgi:hypothetical protein
MERRRAKRRVRMERTKRRVRMERDERIFGHRYLWGLWFFRVQRREPVRLQREVWMVGSKRSRSIWVLGVERLLGDQRDIGVQRPVWVQRGQ